MNGTSAPSFTSDFRDCVAEAIATFTLCFIGGGAICADALMGDAGFGLLGIAIAHGLALSIAVSATMNISGGHVNPAVTMAMLVTGRISPLRGVLYIISQCAGGAVAGVMLLTMFSGRTTPTGQSVAAVAGLGTPNFNPAQVSSGMALLIEAALTFLLLFAVFGTAVDRRHPAVGGFGIGLVITMDILVGGPLTGAAMNPARVFGTGVFSSLGTFWAQQWVYWVGPCTGAVVAGVVYDAVLAERPTA